MFVMQHKDQLMNPRKIHWEFMSHARSHCATRCICLHCMFGCFSFCLVVNSYLSPVTHITKIPPNGSLMSLSFSLVCMWYLWRKVLPAPKQIHNFIQSSRMHLNFWEWSIVYSVLGSDHLHTSQEQVFIPLIDGWINRLENMVDCSCSHRGWRGATESSTFYQMPQLQLTSGDLGNDQH